MTAQGSQRTLMVAPDKVLTTNVDMLLEEIDKSLSTDSFQEQSSKKMLDLAKIPDLSPTTPLNINEEVMQDIPMIPRDESFDNLVKLNTSLNRSPSKVSGDLTRSSSHRKSVIFEDELDIHEYTAEEIDVSVVDEMDSVVTTGSADIMQLRWQRPALPALPGDRSVGEVDDSVGDRSMGEVEDALGKGSVERDEDVLEKTKKQLETYLTKDNEMTRKESETDLKEGRELETNRYSRLLSDSFEYPFELSFGGSNEGSVGDLAGPKQDISTIEVSESLIAAVVGEPEMSMTENMEEPDIPQYEICALAGDGTSEVGTQNIEVSTSSRQTVVKEGDSVKLVETLVEGDKIVAERLATDEILSKENQIAYSEQEKDSAAAKGGISGDENDDGEDSGMEFTRELDLSTRELDVSHKEVDDFAEKLSFSANEKTPTKDDQSSVKDSEIPTEDVEVATMEADVPTEDVEVATMEADVPTEEADVSTQVAEVPTEEAEPLVKVEDPIDISLSTAQAAQTFDDCHRSISNETVETTPDPQTENNDFKSESQSTETTPRVSAEFFKSHTPSQTKESHVSVKVEDEELVLPVLPPLPAERGGRIFTPLAASLSQFPQFDHLEDSFFSEDHRSSIGSFVKQDTDYLSIWHNHSVNSTPKGSPAFTNGEWTNNKQTGTFKATVVSRPRTVYFQSIEVPKPCKTEPRRPKSETDLKPTTARQLISGLNRYSSQEHLVKKERLHIWNHDEPLSTVQESISNAALDSLLGEGSLKTENQGIVVGRAASGAGVEMDNVQYGSPFKVVNVGVKHNHDHDASAAALDASQDATADTTGGKLAIKKRSDLKVSPTETAFSERLVSGQSIVSEQPQELPDSGKFYFRFNTLSKLDLQGVKRHQAQYCIEFDDGTHTINTPYMRLNDVTDIDKEFELLRTVTETSRKLTITFKVKYQAPDSELVEITERVPLPRSKLNIFGKTKYKLQKKFVTKPVKFDEWSTKFAKDGSFARCTIDLDQAMIAKIKNHVYKAKFDVVNEWERDPKTGSKRLPYKMGELSMDLLFLARTHPLESFPSTIATANDILEKYREQQKLAKEGYLYQEGGDLQSMKRRWFRLEGAKLIAHNEFTKKARTAINLLKVSQVLHSGTVHTPKQRNFTQEILMGESFKLCFANGEEITFSAETTAEKEEWTNILEEVVDLNKFHQPWVKSMY